MSAEKSFLRANRNRQMRFLTEYIRGHIGMSSASFQDLLGKLLDSVVISLAKISAQAEVFADQCVLNGFVPPHPADVERAIKMANSAPEAIKEAVVPIIELVERENEKLNFDIDNSAKELPDLTAEDYNTIKKIASRSKNPLNQNVINKIHESIQNLSTRDARNVVRSLIAKGEIKESNEDFN